MILQSLAKYYARKAALGANSIAPPGWLCRGIDYVVVIDQDGEVVNFETVFTKEKGKITTLDALLPAIGKQAAKHSNSGKDANLLWDNASFVLGRGKKGKLKLDSFISTMEKWLHDCDDEGLDAVKAFYKKLKDVPDLALRLLGRFGLTEDFEKRDPIVVFRLSSDNTSYIHARPTVRAAYERRQSLIDPNAIRGTCLITGQEDVPITKNETVIKGVWGSQTSGANIVSFNDRAFESYGKRKRQGENSPVSQSASFAYTTALNHLLRKDSPQRLQVGDASTVFWADRSSNWEEGIPNIFNEPKKDNPDSNVRAVESLYRAIDKGLLENNEGLTQFFVLGLAPNAARIAIRFWHHGTVAELAARIKQHFDDLSIAHADNETDYLSLPAILASTGNETKFDKNKSGLVYCKGKYYDVKPNLGGELMRSILEGLPYPQTLLAAAVRRVRAEREITYPRAALIKACINRNTLYTQAQMKEELKMSLDKENDTTPYVLGQLFFVLEEAQWVAHSSKTNPGSNVTIRDRFYGAASSTPATVFPTLLRLYPHHISKASKADRKWLALKLEKLVDEIINKLPSDNPFPTYLTVQDQGRFHVGYYHQRQDFFNK